MRSLRTICLALVLASAATTAAGCAPIRMALPPDLRAERVPDWPVELSAILLGDQSVGFGPYVAKGHRGWTTSAGGETSTRITFNLAAGGPTPLAASCTSAKVAEGNGVLGLVPSSFTRQLVCDFGPEGKLMLRDEHPEHVAGGLQARSTYLAVTSTREAEKTGLLFDHVGFVFHKDGKPIAAVQTLYPHRVWMAEQDLTPEVRDGLALAIAALFLNGNWSDANETH